MQYYNRTVARSLLNFRSNTLEADSAYMQYRADFPSDTALSSGGTLGLEPCHQSQWARVLSGSLEGACALGNRV